MDNDVIVRDDQGWHLDKRIGVAHILTTVSLLIGLGSVMWALETRVTQVEQRVTSHETVVDVELKAIKARDRELMEANNRHYLEILRRLERIEDGVDRHIESTAKHGGNT